MRVIDLDGNCHEFISTRIVKHAYVLTSNGNHHGRVLDSRVMYHFQIELATGKKKTLAHSDDASLIDHVREQVIRSKEVPDLRTVCKEGPSAFVPNDPFLELLSYYILRPESDVEAQSSADTQQTRPEPEKATQPVEAPPPPAPRSKKRMPLPSGRL